MAADHHREVDVSHCIAIRESMDKIADRMATRDHKHYTGSNDWLARFMTRHFPRAVGWFS
jgi:hypothetical protein